MNVSEITDERLKHIANGGSWMSDHPEILALAQDLLDRRAAGKVDVVKSCDNCGNVGINQCRACLCFSNYIRGDKPTERAEIEPWVQINYPNERNALRMAVEQLQRRLEAVENEMRKQ